MPLVGNNMIVQTVLVFAMIGLLGLVLKWTFKRDKDAPAWPGPSQPWSPSDLAARAVPPFGLPVAFPPNLEPPAVAELREPVVLDESDEDYGLLTDVVRVESADEANRIRSILAAGGIRATTTPGPDGRHRVLVFLNEVHRARRLAGGANSG